MKSQEVIVQNGYSCQVCQKFFYSSQEVIIEAYLLPVCSKKCYYKTIYRVLKEHEIKTLLLLANFYAIFFFCPDCYKNYAANYQKLIYEVCKSFISASIKEVKT